MLSSVPKFADRAFILGAFLPTLLFAICGLLLFYDQEPAKTWIEALTSRDLGQAAYVLLAVWALAALISMLNHWLYRFLEGYLLPSWVAEWLKRRNRKRLQRSLQQLQTMLDEGAAQAGSFWYHLQQQMPLREDAVLPTRFGNAIRAFEIYPSDIYGADAITIWLRLVSVMPKFVIDQIQEARTTVDFFINCWFFSLATALLAVARIVSRATTLYLGYNGAYQFTPGIAELPWVFGSAIASFAFYQLAVISVPAWGEMIRSAFDCYLPALATQLGFELPRTEAERRCFWTTFSQQLLYRRGLNGNFEKWKQASKTPTKEAEDLKRGGEVEGESDVASL
jgi:hypothetical protein